MYDAPSYVWALVLIGTIGIPLTTAIMLYRGALAARMRKGTAVVLGIVAAYLLGAWLVARGEWHRRAVWFNVFGLLDLAVALTIGFLFGLGPWMPFEITPTTEALAFLPLALVPTVAVPVAITLHIVSLRQLRAAARENDGRRLI